jgi:hypothetical protein
MKSIIVKSFRTDMVVKDGTDPNVQDFPAAAFTFRHLDDTLHMFKFTPKRFSAFKDMLDAVMDKHPSVDERDAIFSLLQSPNLAGAQNDEVLEHAIVVHCQNIPLRQEHSQHMLAEHYVGSTHLIVHKSAFDFRFSTADGSVSVVRFPRSLLPYLVEDLIRLTSLLSARLRPS